MDSIELLIPYRSSPIFGTQPVFVNMPNIPGQFVPFFSTKEKLESGMSDLGIEDYDIKMVTDKEECVESVISQGFRIMLDPYVVDGVKTRWTELVSEK
ncbi:MAG: hypothetical protein ACW99G_02515 [Candidatus Thorarchaeota archaeon]|jgi:hypothetical protein